MEKENGAYRTSMNAPCSAPRDKLEQLSCKSLEERYFKIPLSSNAVNDLKKGFYKVTMLDKILFAINKKEFWYRLYNDSNDMSLNIEARRGVGLTMDKLEGDKIFVATKLALINVIIDYNINPSKYPLKEKSEQTLKIIYLYGQYKYNTINKPIIVSSTFRLPSSQWREMKNPLEKVYDPNSDTFNSYYKYEIDQKYKEIRDSVGKYKPLSTEDSTKLDTLMIKWIEDVSSTGELFLHCQKGVQVADISPSEGAGSDSSFIKALDHCRKTAKLVTSKTDTHPTILFGESFGSNHKEEAHHISFKS